jgi:hypothetical protein
LNTDFISKENYKVPSDYNELLKFRSVWEKRERMKTIIYVLY